MKKTTAIIPTMLKNINVLTKLIENLVNDPSVEEIIIINNSDETIFFDKPKVRIISKGRNLYVNPSWNLGVSEAKTEYVTLINDDIIIPNNFCCDVLDKMDEKSGVIGIDSRYVKKAGDEDSEQNILSRLSDNKNEIILTPVSYRTKQFGIMMFFNKKIYTYIPEDLKIFFGDDFLIHNAKKAKKQNAIAGGKLVFHLGSLTSASFESESNKENAIYKQYFLPWYKRILYFYERDTHYVLNFLFFQFAFKKGDEF